jgi:8-oxo-dGTP pyrophosphatase MutT (NUDIX family)
MIRELEEETGIKVEDVQFIKLFYLRYPNRDYLYYKYKVIFNDRPTIIINPAEHNGFDWFTPEEALEHSLLL